MSKRLPIFDALPPYLGGKRRLLGNIFRDLPPPNKAPVFADAFLGGGSVSLYAKLRGYRVLCNDLGERSVVVGRALIDNDGVRITRTDELSLFDPPDDRDRWLEQRLAPDVVTQPHAEFLCGAMAVAKRTAGTRGWLFRLLCVKYLLDQRPSGNFGGKTFVHQVAAHDWDNARVERERARYVRRMAVNGHVALVTALAGKINGGVLATGLAHEVHQEDATTFLRGCHADIAFLDPPYASTTGYDATNWCRPLDEMLLGRQIDPKPSAFTKRDSREQLLELLDAAAHIPVVALSYGGPVFDAAALETMMQRTRSRVAVQTIAYSHLQSLTTDAAKSAKNRELILVGWR